MAIRRVSGARSRRNAVRTLQWRNIDFDTRCLRFGKDKTAAGSGSADSLEPAGAWNSDLLGSSVPRSQAGAFRLCNGAVWPGRRKPVISPAKLPIPLTRPSRWEVGKPHGRRRAIDTLRLTICAKRWKTISTGSPVLFSPVDTDKVGAKVRASCLESGSSGRTRTYNPSVNSRRFNPGVSMFSTE